MQILKLEPENKHNIQNDRDNLRSQSLDLLRFPLAVIILTIHVPIFNLFDVDIDKYPFFIEIHNFINRILGGQSVPVYFFISGFVFFLGAEFTKGRYIQKLKNRVKTLLIPYFVWNTIAIIFAVVLLLPCFSSFLSNSDFHKSLTLSNILSGYWSYDESLNPEVTISSLYPFNIPLWFIRDLMIVVLCSPVLHWIQKHTRYYFVLLLGVLWFASSYSDSYRIDQIATAFFFFGLGAYMSINQKDILIVFGKFFKLSVILYLSLAFLYIIAIHYNPEVAVIIKKLNIFVGVFFAYNMAAWLLKHNYCKVSPFLASSSFFIYVSHILIVGKVVRLLILVIKPSSDISVLMVYILAVILTLAILLLSFYLLRRYTPSLLKVLVGRK